jgi:DNA-binding GntR family transcriptional regulator
VAALQEHAAIVAAIRARDGEAADAALRRHISNAFETRLMSRAREAAAR